MSACERCWNLGGSTADGYAEELARHRHGVERATDRDVNAALRRLQGDVDRLTRERDEAIHAAAEGNGCAQALESQLAASQAECAALREALRECGECDVVAAPPGPHDYMHDPKCLKCAALSRPPGSREALLSYLNRCGVAAWDAGVGVADDASAYAQMSSRDLDEQRDIDVAAIVARLLREGGSHE